MYVLQVPPASYACSSSNSTHHIMLAQARCQWCSSTCFELLCSHCTCRPRLPPCARRSAGRTRGTPPSWRTPSTGCPPPAGSRASQSLVFAAWHGAMQDAAHHLTRITRMRPATKIRENWQVRTNWLKGAAGHPTSPGAANAFLILVRTSASLSSINIADAGSLFDIFSCPCGAAAGCAGVTLQQGQRRKHAC